MNYYSNITADDPPNRLSANDSSDEITDTLGSQVDRPSLSPKLFTAKKSTHLNRIPSNGLAQHNVQPQPSQSDSRDNQIHNTSDSIACAANEKLCEKPGWKLYRSVDVGSVFTMDITDQDCEICIDDAEVLDCFKFENNYVNVSSSSNSNRLLNMHQGCRPPPSASLNKTKCSSQVKFKLNRRRQVGITSNATSDIVGSDEAHDCEHEDASDDNDEEDDEELDRDSYDNEIESMLSEEEGDNSSGATSGVMRINNDNGTNRKQLHPSMTRQLSASLPIQVPVNILKASKGFKKSLHDDLCENDDDSLSDDYAAILEDPSKIPESIEALARSVRDSTEVFGALPSRRFNTGELVRSLRLT